MGQGSYHHDDLRSELIDKGLKLLDEEGYEGFSLRKVAKACNVSHAAPYRHFKNKDELIMAIAFEAMRKFSQCLQSAVDQYPDDPKRQLKEMGYAYIKFFTENPEYLRLIFLSDIQNKISGLDSDDIHCLGDKTSSEHPFDVLYQTVERCLAETSGNSERSMDRDALLLYSWGLVHGIAILIARKEFPYNGDYLELVRTILEHTNF